jgi:hypothetical protein
MTIQELKVLDIFKFMILIFLCKGCNTVKPIVKNNQISHNCELVTKNINEKRNFIFDNENFDYEYYIDFVKNVRDGIFITFFYEQNPYHKYLVLKDFNFDNNTIAIEVNKKLKNNNELIDIINSFNSVKNKKEFIYSCLDESTNQVIFVFEMRKNGERYMRFSSIGNLNFELSKHNLENSIELQSVFGLIEECMDVYWDSK